MLNNFVQRPSALPAACALVPSTVAAANPAHVIVGFRSVAVDRAKGTALAPTQLMVQGINVSAGGFSAIELGSVGGVRGKPPRGRPV